MLLDDSPIVAGHEDKSLEDGRHLGTLVHRDHGSESAWSALEGLELHLLMRPNVFGSDMQKIGEMPVALSPHSAVKLLMRHLALVEAVEEE
jgi:hypothetical protein